MAGQDRHRRQFDAYCEAIFDHRVHLTTVERAYVERVFARPRPVGADSSPISWKTYGHKIEGQDVASYQLGLGVQSHSERDVLAVERVLDSWLGAAAVEPYLDLLARSRGAGLGWVFPRGERRLYCVFDQPDATTERCRESSELAALCTPEFILAWTFRGATTVERKTYYYPLRPHWPRVFAEFVSDPAWAEALAVHASRIALVLSQEQSPRLQFDVCQRSQSAVLRCLGNVAAVRLSQRCAEIDPPLQLDTVAVTSRGLGLYFD